MLIIILIIGILIGIAITLIPKPKNIFPKKHKCQNCTHIYPPMNEIEWIGSRTNFHTNPITKETCYWMLFKDGTQTHDYPFE